MAPKADRLAITFGMVAKLFAKKTTKLGLATTIAALWLTAVPIASAVAQGSPQSNQRGARGGPSGVQPLGPTISAARMG